MPKQDYPRLEIEDFGRQLIVSGDLDPVYIALPAAVPDINQRHRWLIAYWCFYHCGVASYLSEFKGEDDFWSRMMEAATNETTAPGGGRWPRAKERRHFRGEAAINAVAKLRNTYGADPEKMVRYITSDCPSERATPYISIADRAQEHPLFGPWIAFKIADMAERVLGIPVDFTEAEVFMFKDPVRATVMLWRQRHGLPDTSEPKDLNHVIHEVVKHLTSTFSDLVAPPLGDRPIGLQEVETVLCKWKSHMNGHYPLYNDIDEIGEGVREWANVSKTAQAFVAAMPKRNGSTQPSLRITS